VAAPAPNAPQTQADSQPQGQQPQPEQPQPAPVQDAKPTAKPVDTPAPAPVTVQPPVAAQAPANAPTGLQRQVPLYRAVETTGTLLHIAAQRGVTHARLNLKPVELGGIEVRLHSTADGVAAKLVADSPEAAKMLDQARDDLKRSLEERNVNLLSLEVSTSNGDQRDNQPAFNAFAEGFGEQARPGRLRNARLRADEAVTETPAPAETNLVLPNGVLVDVLA
jgi:flagellar hook-length control protein FliK